ncbi:PTS cellobiose transporter subunit IIC [Bifidobacterium aquikefiri]|uniref:PTS cellobiose transporter subunit IIC n=1 Tax=Bifidobacterium aquikefiri TaxID=1653207 RepID=UPI0023F2529B|nr:PTS cellobiose transporter subunit IIC [Bifidobacterium aquikefiri]
MNDDNRKKVTPNQGSSQRHDGLFGPVSHWIADHPNLWEFILFNVLSNVSTITRFIVAWVGTAVFVSALGLTTPFSFLLFNYTTPGSNGNGGFLTFLAAEVLAQAVNFVVQMKWVFKSDSAFADAAWKYAVLAVLIVVVNLVLPGYVTALCMRWGMNSAIAATVASVVNTLLAVVVSYPLLKFWIMPKRHNAQP